jgi:hypothetical protein
MPNNQYGGFLQLPPAAYQQFLAQMMAAAAPASPNAPRTPNRKNTKKPKTKK